MISDILVALGINSAPVPEENTLNLKDSELEFRYIDRGCTMYQ
jgi:hypothetical protein